MPQKTRFHHASAPTFPPFRAGSKPVFLPLSCTRALVFAARYVELIAHRKVYFALCRRRITCLTDSSIITDTVLTACLEYIVNIQLDAQTAVKKSLIQQQVCRKRRLAHIVILIGSRRQTLHIQRNLAQPGVNRVTETQVCYRIA